MKGERKAKRAEAVLSGVIDLYLSEYKPVSSSALKESLFSDLSSATLRNDFSYLEELGYLEQSHSSSGRIPTKRAFSWYAMEARKEIQGLSFEQERQIEEHLSETSLPLNHYIQKAAECLSKTIGLSVLLTAPRFNQDFIKEVRLISLEQYRLLAVILTQFSAYHTEILSLPCRFSHISLRKMEKYLQGLFQGHSESIKSDFFSSLSPDEKQFVLQIYQEISLRYRARYAHICSDDLFRAGYCRLLNFPEFHDPQLLASALALIEDPARIQQIFLKAIRFDDIYIDVGEESHPQVSFLFLPYKLEGRAIGALIAIGPIALRYSKIFSLFLGFRKIFQKKIHTVLHERRISVTVPGRSIRYMPTPFLENISYE